MSKPVTIQRLVAHVFRWPVATPVRTSFGVMRDRPMVLVEAVDEEGVSGWGEAWCNFPAVGAEHRARLVSSVFAPAVVGRSVEDPAALFRELTQASAVLAIQAGEPGPVAQCIAGIDTALWDLAARRAGQALWKFLGGRDPRIAVYASGLNPDGPETIAAGKREAGYSAFKLKVGFGRVRDLANLRALRDTLGPHARLMVDANQAWSLDEALAMQDALAEFDLGWIEEPLRADSPLPQWKQLAGAGRAPLAAGENMAGDDQFDAAIASRAFAVLQPDVAKWGGISGCLPVARRIRAAGLRYCPHFLGGGIGLLASAHLLAAAGGDGMLEIDANPNPLRSEICGPLSTVVDGHATLTDAPGLGIVPDLSMLRGLSAA
ncbi:MAG TPA: mandelate racemase/muconate lactonizing enzyme family protein [Usitatibacter sp.]|nr:mandelate racemase/muconate lactonizing enzyme family protein [Usitatibacter sp.]